MKSSLTLGDLLARSTIRQAVIEKGKEIYPKIREVSQHLTVPDGIVTMIEKLKVLHHVELRVSPHLIFDDPCEPMTEHILGYKLSKRGMSTYFILYLSALGTYRQMEEARLTAETQMRWIEDQQEEINRALISISAGLDCSIEDLLGAMERNFYSRKKINSVRFVLEGLNRTRVELAGLREKIQEVGELSYAMYAQLAILKDMVEWPKHPNIGYIVFLFLQKLLKFASQTDFDEVGEKVHQFLVSPEGLRKIALLSQGRRI